MKKVFITLAIIIVLIIVTLMVIHVFFKSDILRLIEEKSSKYIQAELAIGDVHLSMFKNFPNLSVSLDNVVISKEETNTRDTLINIPLFEASVNLRSLISGKEIIINNILLKDCDFMPKVNAEGKANWDIMVPSDTTEVKTEETPVETKEESGSETAIAFNNIEVRNLMLNYQDEQAQTFARVDAVNMALQGNFSETNTILNVLLELKNIYLRQGKSVWVNNTDFKAEFANAERYKNSVLTSELPFLQEEMKQEKIDAFNYASTEYGVGSALKDGVKDKLKGMATLGTVRFNTVQTPKYLVLSGNSLHLFDTDTEGEIDRHLVFNQSRLENSRLTEIPMEGQVKAQAQARGNNVKAYKLSLQTDDKPIELIIYSCLIFTNIPEIPTDPQETVQAIVIGNDFLKQLGDRYPNLKVSLPIFS